MSLQRTWILLTLGLALGLAWFWRMPVEAPQHGSTQPVAQVDPVRSAGTPHPTAPALTTGDKRSQTTQAQLPDAGTPLVQMIDTLRRAAEAGDSRAACRLGLELRRCAEIDEVKASLRIADVLGHNDAKDRATVVQLEQSCGSLAETANLDYPSWLLQAARAGHLVAKIRYANEDQYLEQAAIQRPELVQQYAQYAPKFFAELIALGRDRELETLAEALSASDTPAALFSVSWLALTVPRDPVLARTYMQTLARERQLQLQGFSFSTDPAHRSTEMAIIQSLTFTGKSKDELDAFDQDLSVEQIVASDQAVLALIRARAQARAEFATRISAVDMHRLKTEHSANGAADSSLCEFGVY